MTHKPLRLSLGIPLLALVFAATVPAQLKVVNLSGAVYDGNGGPLLPGRVYVLKGVTAFPPFGKTLTVRSGAIIKVEKGNLPVLGSLQCDGATFTSIHDDGKGGDSNSNGSKTTPAKGDWGWLELSGSGTTIKNTKVFYGGKEKHSIWIRKTGVTLDGVTVRDSKNNGIEVSPAGAWAVRNCKVENCDGRAYTVSWFEDVQNFTNNMANGNKKGDYCAFLGGGKVRTMTVNKRHSVNNNGVIVLATDAPYQQIVVPAQNTLTLGGGMILKFGILHPKRKSNSGKLSAYGNLNVQPGVVFTHLNDDTAGGDTRKDGFNSPTQQWEGILLAHSTGSKAWLTATQVRYARKAIFVAKDDTILVGCSVERSSLGICFGGKFLGAKVPRMTDCTIRNNGENVCGMPWRTLEQSTGNKVEGSGGAAFGMAPSITRYAVLVRSENLPASRVLHVPSLLIFDRGSLEISHGAILKFALASPGLGVGGTGKIRMIGRPELPITLTSYADRTGGNTHETNDLPAPGNWRGVSIGSAQSNVLKHVQIRFAGGSFPSLRFWRTTKVAGVRVEEGRGTGVVVDERQDDVSHVIVRKCTGDGIQLRGRGYDLKFSTVVDNEGAGVRNASGFAGNIRNVVSQNNKGGNFVGFKKEQLFHCNGLATGGQGNFDEPSKFKDQKNGDLTPSLTSPNLDRGMWLNGDPTADFWDRSRRSDGKLRGNAQADIGAIERAPYTLSVTGPLKLDGWVSMKLEGPKGQGVLAIGTPGTTAMFLNPFGFVVLDLRFPVLTLPILPNTISKFKVPNNPKLRGLRVAVQALGDAINNPWGGVTEMWQGTIE